MDETLWETPYLVRNISMSWLTNTEAPSVVMLTGIPQREHDMLRVILLESEQTEPVTVATDNSKVAMAFHLEKVCSYRVERIGWWGDFLWWGRWVAWSMFGAG